MSTRLTNSDRDRIWRAIKAHAFEKRKAKIEAKKQELSLIFYEDVYSKEDRKHMYALPENAMSSSTYFYVNIAGMKATLHLESSKRIFKDHHHSWCTAKAYPSDHPLAIKWLELENEEKAFNKEVSDRECEVRAILNSVTTVKKLKTIWPECAPFCPAETDGGRPGARLPAVIPTTLNKNLGLPV